MSDTELKEKEDLSTKPDTFEKEFGDKFSDDEKEKLNDLSDQVGKGYTGGSPTKDKKGLLGKMTGRQKGASLGLIGIIISAVFGFATITQGPLQIMHFSQLLQRFHMLKNEEFGDDRSSHFLRNLRNRNRGAERKHLGGVANKFADRFELRLQKESGLRSVYDNATGRHIGYEIIDETKAKSAVADFNKDEIPITDSPPTNGHPADTKAGPFKGRFVNLSDTKYKTRRATIRNVTKGTKTAKITGALGARLLIRRAAVDFHPLKNLKRKADDNVLKWYRARKEDRAKEDAEGTKPPDDPHKTNGDDDDNTTNPDEEETRKNAQNGDTNGVKKKLAIGTSAVGALCALHAISDQVENLKYLNIILPLIRIGTRIVSTGSQVMYGSNDVNVDELGSVTDDLYDNATDSSWVSARSIQAELGQEQTGDDIPSSAKPSKVGDKGPLLGFVDSVFDKAGVAGDVACSAAGQAILGAATGGIIGTIKDSAKSFAGSSAEKKLGITDPTELAAQWIVKKLAGKEISALAKGAELGNYANYGARLAANDTAISMGGRVLSAVEAAEIDQQLAQNIAFENSQKSFTERVFNIYDVDSVIGRASLNMPSSPGQTLLAVIRSPLKLFSSFGFLSKRASAASKASYDYGFPEFGFSVEEQQDPRFEDPFDNADIVEPKLKDLNDKYGKCFSMTVNPDTGNLESGESTRYDDIEKNENCHDNSEDLARYRFYLADKVTEFSLSCNEGDDESCTSLGFGVPKGSTSASSPAAPAATGLIVGDPYSESSSVPCDPRTKDLGTADGYSDGKKYTVRLCSLPNLKSSGDEDNPGGGYSTPGADGHAIVNSRVSGAWFSLVEEAAKSGRALSAGSSFRSMQHQQDLWNKSGQDSKYVARPGYSSHQSGVAIDFEGMKVKSSDTKSCKGRATAPDNKNWVWLHDNAENYGFKQYSAEAWHWDALPTANRCGASQG